MTVLDRLLLAATVTGLAAVVWRVEQLRGEVTDKRIDDAAVALQAWGRDERAATAEDKRLLLHDLNAGGVGEAVLDELIARYAPADATRPVRDA